jgi:hypothetical protein
MRLVLTLCTILVRPLSNILKDLLEMWLTFVTQEEHYAQERESIPEAPRVLLKSYIDKGWLGRKTGRGFYQYD